MNIVFITHYSDLYGANRSLLNLLQGLLDHDVKPLVISPSTGALTDELAAMHIPCYTPPLGFACWMGPRTRLFRFRAAKRLIHTVISLPWILWRIHAFHADLIYTNSSATPVGVFSAILLRRPHVWHIREFGQLDYGYQYDWGRRIFEYFLLKSQVLIANSHSVADAILPKSHQGVHVVYNGVIRRSDILPLQRLSKEYEELDSPFKFGILGRLIPGKGIETAIRALHLVRARGLDAELFIAGDGPGDRYEYELKQLVRTLALEDRVTFLGFLSNPSALYRQLHAVLMCSHFEAMGRVTVEAMIHARPVIGFRQAGTSELIDDERTGLLYDNGAEQLAESMIRLISDASFSKRLGANAWQDASERFVVEVYSNKIFMILSDLVTLSHVRTSA